VVLASAIGQLLSELLQLYVVVIFARVVMSWFPISPGSPLATVFSALYSVTEPVLGPIRRMIPSMGMIDISPLIVVFAIQLVVIPAVHAL